VTVTIKMTDRAIHWSQSVTLPLAGLAKFQTDRSQSSCRTLPDGRWATCCPRPSTFGDQYR
jgi:hypothetical protein